MSWTKLHRITAPPVSAISLNEAKDHLRVDLVEEDSLIQRLTHAATGMVEGPHGVGLALVEQQWELSLDYWPAVIDLPLYPVQSVDSITYVDGDGNSQTLSNFQAAVNRNPATIAPAVDERWPNARDQLEAITVTFTAGYAKDGTDYRANIPEDLRAALLLLVGHLYENRVAVTQDSMEQVPLAVTHILERYRVGRMA